ncbi:UNVERIFIED_CONTAM: hypothetical protein O8I53_13320 [Campylobacter lari]
MPKDYELANLEGLKTKDFVPKNPPATYKVMVKKVAKTYVTNLTFELSDGTLIDKKELQTNESDRINVASEVPAGYKLKNPSDTSYNLGGINVKVVVPVNKPVEPEQPIIEEPDETSNTEDTPQNFKRLSRTEINDIVKESGSTLNARSIVVHKESNLPKVKPEQFSEELKKHLKAKINKLKSIADKVSKQPGTFTFEDLDEFFDIPNKDFVRSIVRKFNGDNSGFLKDQLGRPLPTAEEFAATFKLQVELALRDADEYIAKGLKPRLDYFGGAIT